MFPVRRQIKQHPQYRSLTVAENRFDHWTSRTRPNDANETGFHLDDFESLQQQTEQQHSCAPSLLSGIRSNSSAAPAECHPFSFQQRTSPPRTDQYGQNGNILLHGDDQQTTSSSGVTLVSSPVVSALGRRTNRRWRTPEHPNLEPLRPQLTARQHCNAPPRKINYTSASPKTLPVPGLEQTLVVNGIRLVPVSKLPDRLRSVFSFELFNAVQSKCFHTAYETDDNLVVAAPTGSGKTVIMDIAIMRILASCEVSSSKIVYQAPTKSLCAERCADWKKRFATLGLECAELTGDTDVSHLNHVKRANVIITTPEKWDSVTRKWKDHTRLLNLVELFLIDEVHILGDPRGATLEAVVSRMKTFGSSVRFVALSATIPNSEDIATWLGKSAGEPDIQAARETFGEEFRPTLLEKHVVGLNGSQNGFAWHKKATLGLPSLIRRFSQSKPIIIFCPTRGLSSATAKSLAEFSSHGRAAPKLWPSTNSQLQIADPILKETMKCGIAFHHAGLPPEDRTAIEQAFLCGDIGVICCTSTLAVGVNLPCFLVIILGTFAWSEKGCVEYSDLEIMQMPGRAGRPQFEPRACAVIVTHSEKVAKYEKMITSKKLVESYLHENLTEHLNAEIGLGVVHDTISAMKWLRGSFLSVRMRKNPSHYQLQQDSNLSVEVCLHNILTRELNLLEDVGLVQSSDSLRSTEFGDAMARYCVRFETMKKFLALPPKARISEILTALSCALEFRELRVRAGEKAFYKEVNSTADIKYPINVDIALPAHKVSLIIQSELGFSFLAQNDQKFGQIQGQYNMDKGIVFAHACRLVRCIIDCQLSIGDAIAARNALQLSRSIEARTWDDTASSLRQLSGVGQVYARKLAAAGICSIEELNDSDASRIELVLGKSHPFGTELLNKSRKIPNLRVTIKELGRTAQRGVGMGLTLKLDIGFLNKETPIKFGKHVVYVCCLTQTSEGELLDFRRGSAQVLQHGASIELSVTPRKPTKFIKCFVMCDGIAGTSRHAEIELHNLDSTVFSAGIANCNAERSEKRKAPLKDAPRVVESFDNIEIADDDLLAIGNGSHKHEEIQDVDQIPDLPIQNTIATQERGKRSTLIKEQGTVESSLTSSQPVSKRVKLSNGNWSCNHKCVDKNKCNHECCSTGVAKPRAPNCRKSSKGKQQAIHEKVSVTSPPKMNTKRKLSRKTSNHSRNGSRGVPDTSRTTNTAEQQYPSAYRDVIPLVERLLASRESTRRKVWTESQHLSSSESESGEISINYLPRLKSILNSRQSLPKSAKNSDKKCHSNLFNASAASGEVLKRNHGGNTNHSGEVKPHSTASADMFRSHSASDAARTEIIYTDSAEIDFDDDLFGIDDLADIATPAGETRLTATKFEDSQTSINIVQPGPEAETVIEVEFKDQEKRIENTEKKKDKWAEFQPELYEEFHRYVEIV